MDTSLRYFGPQWVAPQRICGLVGGRVHSHLAPDILSFQHSGLITAPVLSSSDLSKSINHIIIITCTAIVIAISVSICIIILSGGESTSSRLGILAIVVALACTELVFVRLASSFLPCDLSAQAITCHVPRTLT